MRRLAQGPALTRAVLTEASLIVAMERPPLLVDLHGPDGSLVLPGYPPPPRLRI